MRLTIPGFLMAVTLLSGASPLSAQWRAEPMVPIDRAPSIALAPAVLQLPDSLQPAPSTATLGLVGVAGAWGGVLAGAFLGGHLERVISGGCGPGCQDDGGTGQGAGWLVGPALLTPLSVHYANGRRGSLSKAYLYAGLITGAAAIGLMAEGYSVPWLLALNHPWAHVISAVVIEQATAQQDPEAP